MFVFLCRFDFSALPGEDELLQQAIDGMLWSVGLERQLLGRQVLTLGDYRLVQRMQ